MAERAVFLDRDGVINRRRPDHVKSWAEFQFLPGVLPALARLRALGERVVVVTNQSAVGRGLLSAGQLDLIHRRMDRAVRAAGGRIEGVYACPHRPDAGCPCRKPGTGLLIRAAADLRLDLQESILVGDSTSDIESALAAGCRPIRIGGPLPGDAGDTVPAVADLGRAVALIARLRGSVASPC